jgi:hypothetical protein
MKIEMGESLVYSWIRHILGYKIVQTNWKMSPRWDTQIDDKLKSIYEEFKNHFVENGIDRVFKNNTLNQLLHQSEIDVIGINFIGKQSNIIAVEVANHSNGLNYSKGKTRYTVLKKFARTAMVLYAVFKIEKARIIFCSPKIKNQNIIDDIESDIASLTKILGNYGIRYNFELICNESFNNKIINQIDLIMSDISDTSELFLRSLQLKALFENKNHKNSKVSSKVWEDYTVGQMANIVLRDYLSSDKICDEMIENLVKSEFSKQFGLSYPILVKEGNDFEVKRYYVKPVQKGKHQYYICSQWKNRSKTRFASWLNSISQ